MNNLPSVTAKELAMLQGIRDNDHDVKSEDRHGGCWAFVVCEDRSGSAVFGSLVRKGLAVSSQSEPGEDPWLTMTDLGADVLESKV